MCILTTAESRPVTNLQRGVLTVEFHQFERTLHRGDIPGKTMQYYILSAYVR